jgi:3-isopropylmalate/(R)-2-methylmalate dehydratase small subunit
VWGLAQLGVRALIGTSFAGIFFDNCARNGLLAITLDPQAHSPLLAAAADPANNRLTVDLVAGKIVTGDDAVTPFEVEPTRRAALLEGLDAVGQALARAEEIQAFESRHFADAPWLAPPPPHPEGEGDRGTRWRGNTPSSESGTAPPPPPFGWSPSPYG